jgi:hypothetical protein
VWRRPQIATSLTDYRLLKCRLGVVQTRLGVEFGVGVGVHAGLLLASCGGVVPLG